MRNIFKHILFFVIITVFVGVSCKKYPDGPLINFETKMHRIAGNGTKTWDVAFFSVNGYDSTSNLLAQSYYGKYVFHSKKDRNPLRFFVISNNGNYYSGGSWNFNTKKTI